MTKEDSERKKIYSNEYSGKNSNKKNNTSIDFKVEKAPTSKFIKKRSRLEEFNKLMKNKVYGETDLLK